MKKTVLTLIVMVCCVGMAQAGETLNITMKLAAADGPGITVGTVTASQTPFGVVLTPDLSGLAPGIHGFHDIGVLQRLFKIRVVLQGLDQVHDLGIGQHLLFQRKDFCA